MREINSRRTSTIDEENTKKGQKKDSKEEENI
jgi:hypothetical protein